MRKRSPTETARSDAESLIPAERRVQGLRSLKTSGGCRPTSQTGKVPCNTCNTRTDGQLSADASADTPSILRRSCARLAMVPASASTTIVIMPSVLCGLWYPARLTITSPYLVSTSWTSGPCLALSRTRTPTTYAARGSKLLVTIHHRHDHRYAAVSVAGPPTPCAFPGSGVCADALVAGRRFHCRRQAQHPQYCRNVRRYAPYAPRDGAPPCLPLECSGTGLGCHVHRIDCVSRDGPSVTP